MRQRTAKRPVPSSTRARRHSYVDRQDHARLAELDLRPASTAHDDGFPFAPAAGVIITRGDALAAALASGDAARTSSESRAMWERMRPS